MVTLSCLESDGICSDCHHQKGLMEGHMHGLKTNGDVVKQFIARTSEYTWAGDTICVDFTYEMQNASGKKKLKKLLKDKISLLKLSEFFIEYAKDKLLSRSSSSSKAIKIDAISESLLTFLRRSKHFTGTPIHVIHTKYS